MHTYYEIHHKKTGKPLYMHIEPYGDCGVVDTIMHLETDGFLKVSAANAEVIHMLYHNATDKNVRMHDTAVHADGINMDDYHVVKVGLTVEPDKKRFVTLEDVLSGEYYSVAVTRDHLEQLDYDIEIPDKCNKALLIRGKDAHKVLELDQSYDKIHLMLDPMLHDFYGVAGYTNPNIDDNQEYVVFLGSPMVKD